MRISVLCTNLCRSLWVLGLLSGLLLMGCRTERTPRERGAAATVPVVTPLTAVQPVPTYTPTPLAPLEVTSSLYAADDGAGVPPVVYLAAHEIHHLLNACLVPNAYGEYFWRREWVPIEYPYTDQPGGLLDAGTGTIPMPWLTPQVFGPSWEFHPFVLARKALGDRLSPLWVGLYVNDPALAGPVQDRVCDERLKFHDAWAGHRNHSRGRSVRWLGHITVPAREPVVQLHIRSDAGLRVFLGGELLVDAIDDARPWEWSGQHVLTPGIHILRLEYVERRGPVQVDLDWAYGSGERIRQGQTARPVGLRTGPGDHYPVLTTLAPKTNLWLENWAPKAGSQYWLGTGGVPAWWRTWWQGQPGWVAVDGVAITRELDAAAFLAEWEEQTRTAPRAPPTDLCQRSIPAQYLILKTLTRGWHDSLSCTQVTARDLASLDRLTGVLDYSTHAPQAGDLADLANLAEVQIQVGARPLPRAFLPPGTYRRVRLLASDPRILAQDGWATGVQVGRLLLRSGDWLAQEEEPVLRAYLREGILQALYSPALLQGMGIRHLHLNLPEAASLPAELLAQRKDLQELQLRFRVPYEDRYLQVAHPLYLSSDLSVEPLPSSLLQEAPNLEILHLDVPQRRLPTALLTGLPQLKVLRLHSDLLQALLLDWTALDQLEVLELFDTNTTPDNKLTPAQWTGEEPLDEPLSIPADWLEPLPDLRILRFNSKRVRLVPPDLLARSPHLKVVELGGSNLMGLVNLCLNGLPQLRRLHLNWSAPLVTHGNTAWRKDSYESKLLEPIPDHPCQTWTELRALAYLHRNRDFQSAARDAPEVVWPSQSARQWERVTHRAEVGDVLRLQYAVALPSAVLSDPGLHPTVLHLSDPELAALPDTFPGSVDQLRTLRLHLPGVTVLPDTFLAHAHLLRTVRLDLPRVTALPDTFLAHLPTLGIATPRRYPKNLDDIWLYWQYPERRFEPSLTLSLHTPQLTALPEHLLHGAGVNLEYLGRYPGDEDRPGAGPSFTYLELALDEPLALSAVRLTQAAGLTHLALETAQLTALPDTFLAQATGLTHLTLEASQLTALPDTFLAQATGLTHLTLEASQLTALPDTFLAQATGLTHLTLEASQLTALPDTFLAQATGLTHLILEASQLTALPDTFLAQATGLTHLILEAPQLTALPDTFLAQATGLTHLILEAPQLTALPDTFLTHNMQLQSLRLLNVHALRHLPTAFLAHMPDLLEVHLTDAVTLESLPAGFLTRSPYLMELILEARLRDLPADFLDHAPWLDQLVLRVEDATTWPWPSLPTLSVCGETRECITFPYSMPLAALNRFCTWDEETLQLHQRSRCIGIYYSLFYHMPSEHRLYNALYGPWHMACHRDPVSRLLQCGPQHISS